MRFATVVALAAALPAAALAQYKAEMNAVDAKGVGASVGSVTMTESAKGVVLKANLKGLPPGAHGFHLHENANCGPKEKDGKMSAGELAGNHWDPDKAGKHGAPSGHGHKGDLPTLQVSDNGTATQTLTAPRLKLADFGSKALVIHAGGDNYSDKPKPNGGGGDRIACGVIQAGDKR